MNFARKTTSILFIIVIIAATTVCDSFGSTPTVKIPGEIQAVAGGKVLVPFQLSGVQGAEIGGFVIRLGYDEAVLLNPVLVPVGTLAGGNPDLVYGPASDGEDWDYSVGLAFNFAPSQDGILFLIAFDIAAEAYSATVPIRFTGPNEQTYLNVDLASTGFELEIIPSLFIDGSVAVSGEDPTDPFDFEKFQQHWLTDCESPDWDGAYDYVEDCIIDYLDLNYVGDHFFDSSALDSKSRTEDPIPVVAIPQDMVLNAGETVDVPVNISQYATGDIDNDGEIALSDAIMALRILTAEGSPGQV